MPELADIPLGCCSSKKVSGYTRTGRYNCMLEVVPLVHCLTRLRWIPKDERLSEDNRLHAQVSSHQLQAKATPVSYTHLACFRLFVNHISEIRIRARLPFAFMDLISVLQACRCRSSLQVG